MDVLLQVSAQAVECHPAARTAPSGPSRPVWSASLARPLLRSSPLAIGGATVEDAPAVAPSGRRPHPGRARQALPPGSTVDERDAAPAWPCPPAWWVGRSLATRPRAVTARDPPDDAPARGDQHPARLGVQQGLQMQLLAEARRCPSLHPADLRLALPGVPHPRPAVLQPRRPAVPGAWHRADSGRASPAMAGRGDDEEPHHTRRIAP
jgi:hypothetical protein